MDEELGISSSKQQCKSYDMYLKGIIMSKDRKDFDKYGFDKYGYNRDGYNMEGYDCKGYDKHSYNAAGYNRDGYNSQDYDGDGYNAQGLNYCKNQLVADTLTIFPDQINIENEILYNYPISIKLNDNSTLKFEIKSISYSIINTELTS